MGKNHRYKKKIKSEKAKVHIASKTKFLPKGQNVTNTSFKIKSIIIPDQLQEKEKGILLSKRKLSITELVSKLKHYNESVKIEACQDLREIIKKHSLEMMDNYLSLIIQVTSVLIQDKSRSVRKASVKLINEILANIATDMLKPFFNYIISSLKCAMTNIDKNIQEDSLLLLDSLLIHAPSLVALNFEKIFPDFLTLISKLKNNSSLDKTLTLNLGSKLTSVKWRIKVLSRLCGILNAIVHNNNTDQHSEGAHHFTLLTHKADDSCFIPVFKNPRIYENSTINFFDTHDVKKNQFLSGHIMSLIPLLYETWLEILPEKASKKNVSKEGTILNEESAAIFRCIISILYHLYEYHQFSGIETISSSKESVSFINNLLVNFPYSCKKINSTEFKKEFSQLFITNDDVNCIEENLLLIYIFVTLKINLNTKNIKSILTSISTFLKRCMEFHPRLICTNSKYFILILKEILLVNPKLWHKFGLDNREILEKVIELYEKESITEDFKTEILLVLTFPDFPFSSDKHQEWLGRLHHLLYRQQISEKLIDVILNLCKQNHFIQKGLKNSLKQILDNLPSLEIIGTNDVKVTKLKLVYIFYYLDLNDVDLEEIQKFIRIHENLDFSEYFHDMLELRSYLRKYYFVNVQI